MTAQPWPEDDLNRVTAADGRTIQVQCADGRLPRWRAGHHFRRRIGLRSVHDHLSSSKGTLLSEILEITTLRPAPGLTPGDFVAANADINDYLTRQPGFQWRRIVVQDDGTIVDIVAYDNIAHARAGAAGITGEMADSPVHDAIDHRTVDWQLTTVLQHLVGARTVNAPDQTMSVTAAPHQ